MNNILPMQPNVANIIAADLEGAAPTTRARVSAFRLVLAVASDFRAAMDRRYRESGITTQQAALLAICLAAPAPLRQGELALRLGVSQQNVRQLTNSLVRKGLLVERVDPADRRARNFQAEADAAALFEARNEGDFEEISTWFDGLSDDEVVHFGNVLARLLGRAHRGLRPAK